MLHPILKSVSTLILLLFSASLAHAQTTTAPAPSSPSSSSSSTNNDLLSSDEIHKLVDAGQFKDALKALARILNLHGSFVVGYDRLDLLPLKAECQLQIHDTNGALLTLVLARKEAVDEKRADNILLIDGYVQLIKKSPGNIYSPTTGTNKTPIKLLDLSARKSAYDALFADLYFLFDQKATLALTSKTLQPYMDAARAVVVVRPPEFCSTGSNKKTEAQIKALSEHVIKLLTTTIAEMGSLHIRIKTAANKTITRNVLVTLNNGASVLQQQTHRVGLNVPQDSTALQQIIDTCTKLKQAVTELSAALAVDQDTFQELIVKCDTLRLDASDTLNDNYLDANNPAPTGRPNTR